MKSFLSLVLASVLGGVVTLCGVAIFQRPTVERAVPVAYPLPVNLMNTAPAFSETPLDFRAAAARAMPAVVHISAKSTPVTAERRRERDDGAFNPFRFFDEELFGNPFGGNTPQRGTGSGVIYTSDGFIITNNHVVEGANELEVTLFDNRKFKATVVGAYKKSDLAVIKIETNDLSTLAMGDSDEAEVGEWVLAVGNPFDLTSTVTAGIISAKGRSLRLLGGADAIEAFIQTDAAVNPGNSGGALVDAKGRLLGINTAIATRTGVFSGYSFAIPVNLVKRIVDDIIETGSFQRPMLGIQIVELDSDYAAKLGVAISRGVVVQKLVDGGSAQYAGLQPEDIIVKVDGRNVKNVPELQEIVSRAKVGDVLQVTINRWGEQMDIPVRLKGEQ
jgi:serine protease Do